MSNQGQGSRRDYLTATTPDGKIELTEEELSRVSGGAVAGDHSATARVKFTSTTKDKVGDSILD
jgi:bacteriocin-like protein